MSVRGKLVGGVVAGLVSLAAAPGAAATDASIKAAWDANDAEFTKLGKQERKALAAWERSGFRKSGAVLRSITAARKLLATNTAAVTAQPQSSPTGGRAKRFALASNASFDRSLRQASSGVRLTTAGKRAAGKRRFARADRYLARSGRQAATAKKLFRQVLPPASPATASAW